MPLYVEKISDSLQENIRWFSDAFDESADLITRQLMIGKIPGALLTLEGLVDKLMIAESIVKPILSFSSNEKNPEKLFRLLRTKALTASDSKLVSDLPTAMNCLMNGFALFLLDGCSFILASGVQGFQFRNINEPKNETSQKGSRESFVEPFLINMSMIRRRIHDPKLKFEKLTIGTRSKTNVLLCYLRDTASPQLLENVRKKLNSIELDTILAAGYVSPFLQKRGSFLFGDIGFSERPDTVCGKIGEGRVAVIIDGTPNVLIVPYLFVENFQSFDDYANRPSFAFFIRILKYLAFFISLFLPGFYVATTSFHPELLPQPLLLKIAQSEAATPFPIMLEIVLVHIIYEIMREAGLRVPLPLAQSVSIVGALVVGDTAVSSGLIGAPTLMVVAITATASYVTPTLYEPSAVIRLVMIIVGGWLGFWGMVLGMFVILVNICGETTYGIPYTSPITPFSLKGMGDVFWRRSWRKAEKISVRIQDLPGSHLQNEKDRER